VPWCSQVVVVVVVLVGVVVVVVVSAVHYIYIGYIRACGVAWGAAAMRRSGTSALAVAVDVEFNGQ
jgi:hypothetical protein